MTTIAPVLPGEIKALEARIDPAKAQKLHESAKQYEGIFLSQMMSIMFQDVDLNPMSEGSSGAEDQYKAMLTNEYGTAMANNGTGIGLAQPIYKSLLEAQLRSQQEMHK